MKKNFILTAFVACFLVLFMAATSEAQISYTINYTHSYNWPAVWNASFNGGASYGGYYANYGVNITITDPNPPNPYYWPNGNYLAWCISPEDGHDVVGSQLVVGYNVINLKKADWLIWHFPRTAALQVAVWETAIDGNGNLLGGTFRLLPADVEYAAASAMLTALPNLNWNSYYPLTGWVTDKNLPDPNDWQDFLIKPEHPIPEPGTLLLLGTGMLGFVAIARYRRSKKA